MDINNYSYTPYMLDGAGHIYEETETDSGYYRITLEQWGSDPNKRLFVVYCFEYDGAIDICETFPADCSEGWETMRHGYERAARFYNQYSPEPTPLF